jgi:hypothetical protein
VAVLIASDSSGSYSGREPDGVVSLGAEGAAAWRGGWPKEEASAAKQVAASSKRAAHHATAWSEEEKRWGGRIRTRGWRAGMACLQGVRDGIRLAAAVASGQS